MLQDSGEAKRVIMSSGYGLQRDLPVFKRFPFRFVQTLPNTRWGGVKIVQTGVDRNAGVKSPGWENDKKRNGRPRGRTVRRFG